jgi:hypothetical protein
VAVIGAGKKLEQRKSQEIERTVIHCSCDNTYITDRYHGNESLNSKVPAVTSPLAAVVSENRKLKGSTGDLYSASRGLS